MQAGKSISAIPKIISPVNAVNAPAIGSAKIAPTPAPMVAIPETSNVNGATHRKTVAIANPIITKKMGRAKMTHSRTNTQP